MQVAWEVWKNKKQNQPNPAVSSVPFLAGKEQSMALLRHTPLFWIGWNMQSQPLEGFELDF